MEAFKTTTIQEIMKKPEITIQEDDNFSAAQRYFTTYRLTHLCVVKGNNELVGVLSQKYLYKAQSPRKRISEEMDYDPDLIIDGDSFYSKETLDSYILRNIMNRTPVVLSPENPVSEAVLTMAKRNVGFIPIVDEKRKVVGTVTHIEIVDFVARKLVS